MRSIPKEARQITLAVLRDPDLHYRSCWEDISGRPKYNCSCPLKDVIRKIELAEVTPTHK